MTQTETRERQNRGAPRSDYDGERFGLWTVEECRVCARAAVRNGRRPCGLPIRKGGPFSNTTRTLRITHTCPECTS